MTRSPSTFGPSPPLAGYTLLELVVASASAAMLMGGLASSLYIAGQSLDVARGPLGASRTASAALATLSRDLQSALTLSELTATTVTMSVPDRDGDNVPETIRYAWAGTAGDPLTQRYNGGPTTDLATDVGSFSLTWLTRLLEGVSTQPVVLLVSGQAADGVGGLATPSATEQLRIDLMEGWGYDVTVISQSAAQTEINDELARVNVVYVSGEASGTAIGNKLNAATIGIVTESFLHAGQLGFYGSLVTSHASSTAINITNTSHYITTGFTTGNLLVASSAQDMKWTDSATAPDAVTVAEADVAINYPSLLILDANDILEGGGTAAGRRCQLPWGEGGFDATSLNSDGQTVLQRAIAWAAGAGDDTDVARGIVFEGFTEAKQASNATSLAIDLPAGTAAGNLLIAAVATDGYQQGSLSPPAGWNQVSMSSYSGSVTLGVWWRLADGSESGSFDFTWGSGEEAYGWVMRFTGHNPANPIHATATGEGSSSTPTAPTLTTTTDNTLILRIGSFDDDDINVDNGGLSGYTSITMDKSDSGLGTCSGGAAYVVQATAGDSGTSDFALTASEQFVTVTIAIAPDPNP